MKNILLVIIDCLRFDRVASKHMPLLTQFAAENTFFTNYWSSSHCTDPSITHMLTGKHPDALRLYSMMYGSKWDLPDDVEMISQTARKTGYSTGFITNLGRWYKRGVEFFVDCRGWPGQRIFACAKSQVQSMSDPWFIIVHTDDMHTKYTGGSYDAAAKAVDGYLHDLLSVVDMENTCVVVTSDHGEGLGQSGPDGKRIDQHGYGLWDFLTHVPFITNTNFCEGDSPDIGDPDGLTDNKTIYNAIYQVVNGSKNPYVANWNNVCQAGATPKVFHRGIIVHGAQFVRATTKQGHEYYYVGDGVPFMEDLLRTHCMLYKIDYGEANNELVVIDRLKGLGYWEE